MSGSEDSPGATRATAIAGPGAALFAELYLKSDAARYGLQEEEFARILNEVTAKYLPAAGSEAGAAGFLRSLHIEELALARACAVGNEIAWETFLTRYREKLYDAARAITREDAAGHELADSLYAELYGAGERAGHRTSKLMYYNGRGSLEGWLRATLAQEHINAIRRNRRLVSLDEKSQAGVQFATADPPEVSALDPRLALATDDALDSLTPEERFILASYFLDGRTLAEIARTLGVHESTISRRVEKITGTLRARLLAALLQRGMSQRQAKEALECDVRDLTVDVRGRLAQEPPNSSFLTKGSS